MFQQDPQAVGGSLTISALCALIPLAVLFVLIGGLKVRAWVSGLVALVVALGDAVLLFGMPLGQSISAAIDGALFGFFPILWIVINAVWIYNLTVTGALRGAATVLREGQPRPADPGDHHRLLLRCACSRPWPGSAHRSRSRSSC